MNQALRPLALVAALLLAPLAAPAQTEPPELYRLRIVNAAGGAVEASVSGGLIWRQIGRVVRPAASVATGPSIAAVAPESSVAGISPTQLTMRLPSRNATVRSLRVIAAGENASNSTIETDVAPGDSLFRFLAPAPGSAVRLQPGEALTEIAADYQPHSGDRLVIVVRDEPATFAVTLENRQDGAVALEGAEGDRQIIGRVKQPLTGIGRYADCERTGLGSVISYGPSLITVSSVPRQRRFDDADREIERLGGFIIQPSEPALQGTTHPASQLLVEAAGDPATPVSLLFGLPIGVSSLLPHHDTAARVEVKLDGGEWEPLPELVGTIDADQLLAALREATGRPLESGITHLRLLPGRSDAGRAAHAVRLGATPRSSDEPQRGRIDITADVAGEGIQSVAFYLNGEPHALTNRAPYRWRWDTTRVPNGEHLIEIRGMDRQGVVVNTVFTRLRVDN